MIPDFLVHEAADGVGVVVVEGLKANQEINDAEMAHAVADMFERDFSDSREYTADEWAARSWHLRLLEWFWRRVERLSMKIRQRRRR